MCSHLFLAVFVSDKAEVSLENFNVLNVQLVLKFPVLKRKNVENSLQCIRR